MHVLPVVDGLVGVVGVVLDAGAEVDGQLSDEGEAGGVGYVWFDEAPQLEGGVFHQVDGGEVVRGGCAAAFDEALVGGAEERFFDAGVADDGEAAEDEEGAYADGFVLGGGGPDVDDGADDLAHGFLEGQDVG